RSAGDTGGALPPPHVARRTAAVLERPRRPDERGRPAAAPAFGGGALRAVAPAATLREAGHHVHLATERPRRDRLRGLDEARPRLHRSVVALARHQDRAAHHPRRDLRPRRALGVAPDGRSASPGSLVDEARQTEGFTSACISA